MIRLARLLCLVAWLVPAHAGAETPRLYVDSTGVAALFQESVRVAYVFLEVAGPQGKAVSQLQVDPGTPERSGDGWRYVNVLPIKDVPQGRIRYTERARAKNAATAEFVYSARVKSPLGPTELGRFSVSMYLEAPKFAGRALRIDGRPPLPLPENPGEEARSGPVYATVPAAALMVHGGHLQPSPIRAVVRIADPYAEPNGFDVFGPESVTGVEKYRLVMAIENVPGVPAAGPTDGDVVLSPGDSVTDPTETSAGDPGRQLVHDWGQGPFVNDTDKSLAVIGFVGGTTRQFGDTAFAVETPFAVVMVTSLDDRPLRRSRHLLITAVAGAENTGETRQRYLFRRVLHWTLGAHGAAPILSEPVRATVTLPARQDGAYRAWALDHRGRRAAEIPTADGRVEIGAATASHWYEVTVLAGTAD